MSKRKLYDILPPNKKIDRFKKEDNKELIYKNRRTKLKKNFVYILLVIFVVFVVYWNFSSSKQVSIDLYPQTYDVDFTAAVSFSTGLDDFSLSSIELSDPLLPADLLEIEETFTKEFQSSVSENSQKATGVIKVYNESNRKIPLVEGTRFLSSTEPTRLFRIQKRITVPGGDTVEVPVIASETGPEYNIEPASFSIPGLRNYSPPQLYYDVYGKSFSNMQGGAESEVKIISQQDVDKAEREALAWAKEQAVNVLRNKVGQEYKILDKSIEYETVAQGLAESSVGQQKDAFNYQIKLKATTLAVKTDYLDNFAKGYLLSSVPANKSFVEEELKLGFLPATLAIETKADGESKVSADLSINGKIYSEVDERAIKEITKNRKKKDILRYIIEIYPDLRRQPRVSFKPFWAKKACQSEENIEINVNFD